MAEVDRELSAQETKEAIEQHTSFLLTLKSDLEIAKQVLVKHKHDLSVVTAFIKDIKDIQEVSISLPPSLNDMPSCEESNMRTISGISNGNNRSCNPVKPDNRAVE